VPSCRPRGINHPAITAVLGGPLGFAGVRARLSVSGSGGYEARVPSPAQAMVDIASRAPG